MSVPCLQLNIPAWSKTQGSYTLLKLLSGGVQCIWASHKMLLGLPTSHSAGHGFESWLCSCFQLTTTELWKMPYDSSSSECAMPVRHPDWIPSSWLQLDQAWIIVSTWEVNWWKWTSRWDLSLLQIKYALLFWEKKNLNGDQCCAHKATTCDASILYGQL